MKSVGIVGSGVAALRLANELKSNGFNISLFEQSDSLGGRIRTDDFQGYKLDHGFQVLLPGYSELRGTVDIDKLSLKSFSPGAIVWKQKEFHKISDPLRDPSTILKTVFSSLATLKDKLLILKLRKDCLKSTEYSSDHNFGITTLDYLYQYGFSKSFINDFFIPFFSGIFLDRGLNQDAAFFKFLYGMFSISLASVPEKGMGEFTQLIAKDIKNNIKLNSKVISTNSKGLTYERDGQTLTEDFDYIINSRMNDLLDDQFHFVTTYYFNAPKTKFKSSYLYLNSNNDQIVNHVACLSAVSDSYAPKDQNLFSVNSLRPELDIKLVKKNLKEIFGGEVDNWEFLKSYCIKKSLPKNKIESIGLEVGDYLEFPSTQGALRSGRLMAQKVLSEIS